MQNGKIWKMSTEQQKKTIQAYLASIRFMDQQVGRLLDALDRLQLREHTIVVFVSDHGYNLGEHDCWAKTSLWEGTVRVPLIISAPQFTKTNGTTNASITELIDLYPTLVDLAGLSADQPSILQGMSLLPAVSNGSKIDKQVAYSITQGGKAATIRTDRWRYTRWGKEVNSGNEELYDHDQDPEEFVNLAQNGSHQHTLIKMRSLLGEAQRRAQGKM